MIRQPVPITDVDAFSDFEQAAKAVLGFLKDRIGMGLWMVTRVQQEEFVVLHALDQEDYGIHKGTVMRWSDSFCARMAAGQGRAHRPRCAKRSCLRPGPHQP